MTDETPTPHQIKMGNRMARLNEKMIVTNLRLADADGDGFLTSREGAALVKVEIQETPKAAASEAPAAPSADKKQVQPQIFKGYVVERPSHLEPDTQAFDRATLVTNLSQQFGLTPERVEQLVSKALPKGMAPVMTSDLCATNEAAQCMGIPGGKIVKFDKPARTI